jgi:hypothetical protein
MPNLTTNFIQTKIEPPAKGKVEYYRDSKLIGFGLRVREKSMTFFVEKRINGVNRRVTIGKYPLLSPDQVRNDAVVILGDMAKGKIPSKKSDIRKDAIPTLEQAFLEYKSSKELRRNTILSFNRVVEKNLFDWLQKPITAITRNMVDERFRELSRGSKTGTSGKANANITMQALRAILSYASLKHEINGQPLLASNPVSRLTQTRAWHRLPPRQGVIPDHKLPAGRKQLATQRQEIITWC